MILFIFSKYHSACSWGRNRSVCVVGVGNEEKYQEQLGGECNILGKGDGVAWMRVVVMAMAKSFKIYFDDRGKFQGSRVY